ncbi:MAG TPA: efflux RND transporter periplasmic adaptor subunit, partial [Anaeromyxobacteraceae bacterium]|nr:efflux RND transporter periplasmic adaptor subunit [Anaeromyxobacteraceae bacterium]
MRVRIWSSGGLCRVSRRAAVAALALGAACRAEPPPAPPPPVVEVAAVERIGAGRELRLSGTLEAERSIALAFPVPGTVEEVLVREGQAVRRGQPLARLSPSAFRHAVGIAKAQAERAEDASRRLEPMHRNGTVPEVKWIEVQSGLEQARHALGLARKNLDDAVLRAPEDAVVARRNAEAGAFAVPGIPVITLVQTRSVLATAPVPEVEVSRIRTGQPARVVVAALGQEVTGTVRELGVVADPLTRTYPVKVALPNPAGALRVGMVVDVFLPVEGAAPALVVPREAVRVDEAGTPCVYVAAGDGRLARRAVVVDGFVGERTAIAKGLAEGERVVVSGTPMIGDGV